MRVAATSISAGQLAKNNVSKNCDWPYYHVNEYVRLAEYDPNLVYVGGWFVGNYANLQIQKAIIGSAEKVIIHWYGSDTLICREFYRRGARQFIEELKSDRFVNIPANDVLKKELKEWFDLDTTEPLNVPAETTYLEMEKPKEFTVGVYMPCERLDFFQMDAVCEALAPLDAKTIFYHWLPMTQDMPKLYGQRYAGYAEYRYGLNRDEYRKTIADCSCLVRVPQHDAYSISGAEFLMAGRPVVSNQDYPLYPKLIEGEDTVDSLRAAVEKCRTLTVDKEVQEYYRDRWSPDKFKGRLEERCREKWPELTF